MLRRPGWQVVATDICGLPWAITGSAVSHGGWARHRPCGTVQKITTARAECVVCAPPEGSRSFRARATQPHLLYLVQQNGLRKFGHGDTNRLRAHIHGGANVIQVLRGRFDRVVAAEALIKGRVKGRVASESYTDLPRTWGTGSEVVPRGLRIDLSDYLKPPKGIDITHRYV